MACRDLGKGETRLFFKVPLFFKVRCMTDSTQNTASPTSTKPKIPDSSVSCGTHSNWDFGIIWICSEEFEFLDLVHFVGVAFSVESVIHVCGTFNMLKHVCDTHTCVWHTYMCVTHIHVCDTSTRRIHVIVSWSVTHTCVCERSTHTHVCVKRKNQQRWNWGCVLYTHILKSKTSRTKIRLEHSGWRTRQPARTWLLGPGAFPVLIQNNT